MTWLNRRILLAALAVGAVGAAGCANGTKPPASREAQPWQGELEQKKPDPAPAPEPKVAVAAKPELGPASPAIESPAPAEIPVPGDRATVAAIRVGIQRQETELLFHVNLLDYLARCEEECLTTFDARDPVERTLGYLNVIRRARAEQTRRVEEERRRLDELRGLLRRHESEGDR